MFQNALQQLRFSVPVFLAAFVGAVANWDVQSP